MDWLLQSDFNTQVTAAIWSTVVAVGSTIVLFLYTLGLRLATTISARQRVPVIARWRRIFASAVVSDSGINTGRQLAISRSQRLLILEEWNLTYIKVAGPAADNLRAFGLKLGFAVIARRMLHSRKISTQLLAIQTLGHLGDKESWRELISEMANSEGAVSVTAAAALIDIDARSALSLVIPLISFRRDWLQTRVAMFLRSAGSQLISDPLSQAILAGEPRNQIYLLKFAPLMESEAADALAEHLVANSLDPGVLAAALDMLTGYREPSRIEELTAHESWIVRLRTAQLLGRCGRDVHLPMLENLLTDKEWWVRYRAAQSIVSMPFMGPNAIRQLQGRQRDEFAQDILGQVMAEAGLT